MRLLFQSVVALIVAFGIANGIGGIVFLHDTGTYGWQTSVVPGTSRSFSVSNVLSGKPAFTAGVRNGDTISVEGFQELVKVQSPVPGDLLTIEDGGRAVQLRAAIDESDGPIALLVIVILSKLAFLLIALLIAIRRPDDGAARALAVFRAAFGCAIDYDMALISAVDARFASYLFIQLLFLTGGCAGLLFACRFPAPAERGPRAFLIKLVAPSAVLGTLLTLLSFALVYFAPESAHGIAHAASISYIVLYLAMLASMFVGLIDSYRASQGEHRARMRWVLGTFATGFSGIALLFVTLAFGLRSQTFQYIALTILAIPFGLGYVILRHRVIDIGFVINRAVVYTGVSLIVVGTFIVFEWALGHLVEANTRASAAIELSAALALGLSVRFIHERVDRYVDDLFFRERHAAEAAIRRFARETAMITDADVLVSRTIETAMRQARLTGSAFYARLSSAYVPIATSFASSAPLDENDPAILEMRTWHQPLDIPGGSSVPGYAAFPMIVRGQLAGFLACGEKTTHEAFAPDERDALAVLARDAGIALDSLRITRIERELGYLTTEGELPSDVRMRLSSLLGGEDATQPAGAARRSSQ